MKGKSLLAACLIVPLAVASLGLYLYANQAKSDIGRYGFMRVHENALVVQFGEHLVWLNENLREARMLDLAGLRIKPHGDYAFFSDGDLLVYHREQEPGLLDKLAIHARLRKADESATQGADGLYRCEWEPRECTRFAPQLPALDRVFRLAVDPATDSVYVADTAGFKLYKLSGAGKTLAVSKADSFAFPNQLMLIEEQLWVADTNNHRLARISAATDDFAQVLESVELRLDNTHRWPHQFARTPEGWWVNIADRRMANGRVVPLNRAGDVGAPLSVPHTDPMAMAYWQGALWLADFSEPALTGVAADGSFLPAPESPTLRHLAADSRSELRRFQVLGYGGLAAFALVMLAGVGAAWVLERKETLDTFRALGGEGGLAAAVDRPAKAAADGQILWLTNKIEEKKFLFTTLLAVGAAGLALSLWLLLAAGEEPSPQLVQLTLVMAAFIVAVGGFLAWMFHRVSQARLGVIGGSLVLEQKPGRRTIARDGSIRYTKTHLLADGLAVFLGNPHQRFFDRQQLEDYVFPRLKNAHKCSQWQMQKHLWRARDPQMVATLVIVIVVIGLYATIRFGIQA